MEDTRFDTLTRILATCTSRRTVLRGLAGGLFAGTASLIAGHSALADHTPDHCAHEGVKEHLNRNHPKSCCAGLVPDANGRCQAPVGCPDAVLAGGAGPTTSFLVDDDLEVFVNNASVFLDNNENAGNIQPIALGSLANGDDLRVVASDSATSCGGATDLAPITLYCLSTGTSQVINPNRIQGSGLPCGQIFFDETIPVAL